MTEYSLRPAWIKLLYHDSHSPHVANIPVFNWNASDAAGGSGSFVNHEDVLIDADAMILGYIDVLQPIFTADSHFDSYVIYLQPTADDIPTPVAAKAIALPGTNVATYIPASQSTWTLRTTLGHFAKYVFLNTPVAPGFAKTYPSDLNADGLALVAYLTDVNNAFVGRDGGRPSSFVSATATLNEKLRRIYRTV